MSLFVRILCWQSEQLTFRFNKEEFHEMYKLWK